MIQRRSTKYWLDSTRHLLKDSLGRFETKNKNSLTMQDQDQKMHDEKIFNYYDLLSELLFHSLFLSLFHCFFYSLSSLAYWTSLSACSQYISIFFRLENSSLILCLFSSYCLRSSFKSFPFFLPLPMNSRKDFSHFSCSKWPGSANRFFSCLTFFFFNPHSSHHWSM